jgi:hypothetical protein
MVTRSIGKSVCGRAIELISAAHFARPLILIVGGLHGDETEGIMLGSWLLGEIARDEDLFRHVALVPILNPDGVSLQQRWNFRGVDLNRNFPTRDWTAKFTNPRYPPGPAPASEPETAALARLINRNDFDLVIELHSYRDSVLMPYSSETLSAGSGGAVGASAGGTQSEFHELTREFSAACGLPIVWEDQDLGYVITGGLHTFCRERRIHNFTVEVEKGIGQFAIRDRLLAPTLKFIRDYIAHIPARAESSGAADSRYASGSSL